MLLITNLYEFTNLLNTDILVMIRNPQSMKSKKQKTKKQLIWVIISLIAVLSMVIFSVVPLL